MTYLSDHQNRIRTYYREAQDAYLNWGRDINRPGIYGAHMGLDETSDHHNHYEAVARLTQEVVRVSTLEEKHTILDAGCGSGALSFEIATQLPNSIVVGLNISTDQLQTAQQFKIQTEVGNVNFVEGDYLFIGAKESAFDRVIFCESFSHASDKSNLLRETRRVLKPNGRVIIFDAFDNRSLNNQETDKLVHDLEEGWSMPNIPTVEGMAEVATGAGFKITNFNDYSERAVNSAILMGDHAEQKLKEESDDTDVIQKSRLACVATRELMVRKAMKYCFVELG